VMDLCNDENKTSHDADSKKDYIKSSTGCSSHPEDLSKQVGQLCSAKAKYKTARISSWNIRMSCGFQVFVIALLVFPIVFTTHVFAHIFPTWEWMEWTLDGLWGFALEEGHDYTAPVWMGEFGHEVRGMYWINFMKYLSSRDVDFAYWAINGKKWTAGYTNQLTGAFHYYDVAVWENETYGLLEEDYKTVRHTWKMMDLSALMSSPARRTPEQYPCQWNHHHACGA